MNTTTDETAQLDIEGMSCASCARRVERTLNDLDGVEAVVNFATERATITFNANTLSHEDLVGAVEGAGYHAFVHQDPKTKPTQGTVSHDDAHRHDHSGDQIGMRALFSIVAAIPVMLVSMVHSLQFPHWQWAALALTTPIVWWAGWPIHRATLARLRHRGASMDTLITIGTLAAWSWSIAVMTIIETGHHTGMKNDVYLEVAAIVIAFVLTGRWAEARAKRKAGSALNALLKLGAKDVVLVDDITGSGERKIDIHALAVGDLFVVKPGEKVATDGVVVSGKSAVDQALVTGESIPVSVSEHDPVIGGSINTHGRIIVRAEKVGADTALAQIAHLVEQAQSGRANIQRLADRVSEIFVPAVIVIALATLTFWLATGSDTTSAFRAAVAVLIVACPCALGLATPMALLAGTGRGAQLGIVIRGPEVLENARKIDAVVLDKTGTLTTGKMQLDEVLPLTANAEKDSSGILAAAATLEQASAHPIAQAIVRGAQERELDLTTKNVTGFKSYDGLGVQGLVGENRVLVGRPSLLESNGITLTQEAQDALMQAEAGGKTVVCVSYDGELNALLVVADKVRSDSASAVEELQSLGIKPLLLTGDNALTAKTVADKVGITDVEAGVLPARKAAAVRELQAKGLAVAMVGDGVNDAPALAQADLGIAIGSGSDVAIESSDITLIAGGIHGAVDAIRLSRRTLRTIKGNLIWAFAYNIAMIPLAAAGMLDPMLAGGAMAMSSLFVAGNSLRLTRFKPR